MTDEKGETWSPFGMSKVRSRPESLVADCSNCNKLTFRRIYLYVIQVQWGGVGPTELKFTFNAPTSFTNKQTNRQASSPLRRGLYATAMSVCLSVCLFVCSSESSAA